MIARPLSRRGILLPVALFLVAALSATSIAALVLARAEMVSGGADHRHLKERVLEEVNPIRSGPDGETITEMAGFRWIPLHGGFFLMRAAPPGDTRPAPMSVFWQLRPDSVARHLLPGGVEVGTGAGPETGIRAMAADEGCPPPYGRPLLLTRPVSALPLPDPSLATPPRIGPVGIGDLLEQAEVLPTNPGESSGILPDRPRLLRAPDRTRVEGWFGIGVLLGEGDLTLAEGVRFNGILLVRGSLRMEPGSELQGVALVGGNLQMEDGSQILGCPGLAASALSAPELVRPFPITGARNLGRF